METGVWDGSHGDRCVCGAEGRMQGVGGGTQAERGGGLLTVAAGVVLQFVCVFWVSPVEATPPGGKTKNSSSGSKRGSREGQRQRSNTPRCTYMYNTAKVTQKKKNRAWRWRSCWFLRATLHTYLLFACQCSSFKYHVGEHKYRSAIF